MFDRLMTLLGHNPELLENGELYDLMMDEIDESNAEEVLNDPLAPRELKQRAREILRGRRR